MANSPESNSRQPSNPLPESFSSQNAPDFEQSRGLLHYTLTLITLLLSSTIVFAFLLDLPGLPVRIWTIGPLVLVLLAAVFAGSSRRDFHFLRKFSKTKIANGDENSAYRPNLTGPSLKLAELSLFGVVVIGVLAYLLWLGRSSSLLPVGTTVDAVHQYGLAQYIRDSGRLPIHAQELRANLQDGLEYPPAFVTLVALLAGLLRSDVVYLLYPVAALCVALACGTSFALAAFLLQHRTGRLPLATLAAALTFIPYGYTFGSITSQNYFAMALAELLLLLALYFLLVWKEKPRLETAFIFVFTLAALVIDYPTWVLIPAAAYGLVVLFQPSLRWRSKLNYLAGMVFPLALVSFLFLKDRLSVGLGTVANEGDVLLPDLGRYSWPVVGLALVGLVSAFYRQRRVLPLALYSGFIAAEGLAFYVLKNSFGQGSYYSVYKLFYPAVFLLALLAVAGLSWLIELARGQFSLPLERRLAKFGQGSGTVLTLVSSVVVFVLGLALLWVSYPEADRAYPVVTADTVKVAEWMKQNLQIEQYSVGYGLPPGTPAYWVQVGFLKQPQGNRAKILLTGEPLTFEQWFYNTDSEKYFLTDNLARVNLDERLSLLYSSGSVGVVTRTPAYSEQRALRQSMTLRYKAELNTGEINLTAEASFSSDPSQWLRLGLVIEPEQGGTPVFEQITPAEPNRERQEYMGIHFQLPSLKVLELYTNGLFPPVKNFGALTAGRYRAYIQLYRNETAVERRPLFSFAYDGNKQISFDPAQRIQQGQFLFDGPLSPNVTLPASRLDFGPDAPQLAGYELKGGPKAGDTVQLDLQWFNPAASPKNYRVVVEVLDSSGQTVTHNETVPLNGLFPVWFWPANQPVIYSQSLKLPAKPGLYTLAVSLVDPLSGQPGRVQKLDKVLDVS